MTGVFTIPPDVSFVEALAEGLWLETGRAPLRLTDMLVLLPTRRAGRHLREAFLRVTNGHAALLPRMQPLGDVDEAELVFTSEADFDVPPAIAPLRRQMLLTRLIVQKDKELPLDQAARLAEALAGLLDQVQIERKDFSGLQNLVQGELAKHWQDTVEFLEIVTAAWPRVLKEEGCIDPAERRNLVLAAQAESWKKTPPPFPVIAAGSTASMPAVAELLAVVAGLPQGRVVLPGLDQELDEEAWQEAGESHPQYGMKKWLELADITRADVKPWPAGISERPHRVRLLQEAMRPAGTTQAWRELDPSAIPAAALDGLSRLETEHQQEEADVIALRLRAALEEKEKTAALVTPDRALAERVAAALRRWGIEADDSAGTALLSLPEGSFLRDVLQAASPEATAIDYLSLLKHPLAACGLEPAACRSYARRIETDIWRGVSLAEGWQGTVYALREKFRETRGDFPSPARGEEAKTWACESKSLVFAGEGSTFTYPSPNPSPRGGGLFTSGKSLVNWLEQIAALFEPVTINWPVPLPLDERIRQHMALAETLAATHETPGAKRLWRGEAGEDAALFFDDWRQAAKDLPPLTGGDYARLFTALLGARVVRPAYGRHPRLSILGPLEARLHHAGLTILGGMNEGTWPPQAAVDPWMSRPMKRDFGLPLPERRIGLSAHDFVQLASAPEVLLTRARRVEGSPAVPSRFLLQAEAVLQALGHHGEAHDALEPDAPWRTWAKQLDTPAKITSCLPPEPRPPVDTRPKKLSVTEIGTWLRNPYAIYARRILNLKRLEDIDADVDAAERGSIIHDALEKFLARHKDAWPPDPLETLLDAGRAAFAPFRDRPQVAAFWWPRFERIAAWFVAREQARRQTGIRVLGVECEGSVALANGKFTLKGRADRIDRLPDGSAAIIDYKTGALPVDKNIAIGYEPQLPLLALIAGAGGFENLGALQTSLLSYWQLKGVNGGENVKDVKGDTAALIEEAREKLEQLLAAFSKPATAYRAVPKPRYAPRYDDYAHLARLAEWGQPGEES
ncbi:MAG: double-strand break repair protein AddB [Alphaproteobacteria bacterium]|nr:double-strand break repair protein AddB [Alphaproteobacteria bacterium]